MILQSIDTPNLDSPSFDRASCAARQLDLEFRKDVSLQALCRTKPLTRLAARYAVSRKFVYQQKAKATAAVDQAFQPPAEPQNQVLFHLPVTKDWLQQMALSLTLIIRGKPPAKPGDSQSLTDTGVVHQTLGL